jgi:lipoate-protein ligase B
VLLVVLEECMVVDTLDDVEVEDFRDEVEVGVWV